MPLRDPEHSTLQGSSAVQAGRGGGEARALARLSHPNVVHVYEVGEIEGQLFVAMEHVDGQDLARAQVVLVMESGGGALDIGKQQVQLSMFPEFKDKKAGLNGYGLPIRLAGGWDGIGLSLDWDFLRDKAVSGIQAKAGSQIQNELDKLGGNLKDKLGLGSSKPAQPAQTPATPAPAPASSGTPETQPSAQAQESPQSAQDRLKAEADKAFNKLFKKKD